MNDRALTAIMAAIIFGSNRDDLHEDDPLEEIRECVSYAQDILIELDKPEEEDDEPEVEVIQPNRRRR